MNMNDVLKVFTDKFSLFRKKSDNNCESEINLINQ